MTWPLISALKSVWHSRYSMLWQLYGNRPGTHRCTFCSQPWANRSNRALLQDSSFRCTYIFRASTCIDINTAQNKLLAKKGRPLESIPPMQHISWAVYQRALYWGQALHTQPEFPGPSEWGWKITSDCQFQPIWTTIPEAATICNERRGCTKWCTARYRLRSKHSNVHDFLLVVEYAR